MLSAEPVVATSVSTSWGTPRPPESNVRGTLIDMLVDRLNGLGESCDITPEVIGSIARWVKCSDCGVNGFPFTVKFAWT